MEHGCVVVAPSLILRKPGDRVKTDRRDAIILDRLHGAGELTPVWVPDETYEAIRDLVRARLASVVSLRQARQQLSGFLFWHGTIVRFQLLVSGIGPRISGPRLIATVAQRHAPPEPHNHECIVIYNGK